MRRTASALEEALPSWGVAVLESHHAPDFTMEWRTHPFVKLLYVFAGEGELHSEEGAIAFGAGDLLVVPAGRANRLSDAPGAPVSVYVLCLARDLLAFDPRVERSLKWARLTPTGLLAVQANRLFRRLIFQQRGAPGEASLGMVVDALALVRLVFDIESPGHVAKQDAPAGDAEMARYVEHLDRHFFEAGDVDSAAASLGLSRRSFTQRFRAMTGHSWLEYVHHRAIDHSCQLLSETDKPVALVAFECGFGDLSSFYRRFKALTGTSPAAWRRAAEFAASGRKPNE